MTPLIVTDVETFWKPEPWFVVVLTTTGAAFLLALGWLLSRVLRRYVLSLRSHFPAYIEILAGIGSFARYLMTLLTLVDKQIEGAAAVSPEVLRMRHWKWSPSLVESSFGVGWIDSSELEIYPFPTSVFFLISALLL